MANTNIKSTSNPLPETKPRGGLFKKVLILFLILILGGIGFALGIYLKFIDPQTIISSYKLHEYPIIGQYLAPPKTNFEPVDLDKSEQMPQADLRSASQTSALASTLQDNQALRPADSEKEKQVKMQQQEEAKKISKLARLYENMKPDEVVPILNRLDDDVVIAIFNRMDESQVAKIMALIDSDRAARLSQAMIRPKPQVIR